ncbi:prosaposin isoform X1 [Polypterus senegalus]|uniref:prosaposin isoform X1 n=1 Tax=Polypterus senegalus TaxID=55291 RepID=UPI001964F489|nr:prosaposin isoform X1 [Polypterus senegalus]
MLPFILLLVSTATASPLLGKEQCTKGSTYWCQNVKTASQCGAVSHCQENVWNQPTAKSVPCDLCKEVLTVIGNLLKNNSTEPEIMDYLEKACQLIPDKTLSSDCKEMVDNYFPVVFGIITGELDDPNVACGALGLCHSMQKEMAEVQKILSNEIPDADLSEIVSPFIANVPLLLYPQEQPKAIPEKGNGDLCHDCVVFITDAQEAAKANSTFIKDYINRLEKECELLGPGLSDMCKEYVSQYGPLIFQQLMSMDQTPEQICTQAGFCSPENGVPMETLVAAKMLPALEVVKPTKIEKPAPKLVKVRNSPQCVMCEFVMKEIESLIQKEASEESLIQAMEKVCSILPSTLTAQCQDFIEAYGKAILEILLQEVDPKSVCTLLGLCKQANRLYIPVMNQESFKAGDYCQMCKMAISYVDKLLEQNSTEAEIEAAVEKMCSFLPDAARQQCDQMVEEYEPMIVQLLLQMMDPDFVCTKLGACVSANKYPILGVEECTWGPAFWCKNMDTASRCNAVEHCKRHVWN